MVIAIISIVAAIFLALYVSKSQDYKALERDNKWLKEQRDRIPEPVAVDEDDLRLLDKESAMKAIRFNGFVPEEDGNWISFMFQGEYYLIDTERFPALVLMRNYKLDRNEWDMDLMHKAAHQVSDDMILAKVIFSDDEEAISFQISAIENRYGHFKDSLPRYINIIEEARGRMNQLYNEAFEGKDNVSVSPRPALGMHGEKKVLS